MFTAGREAPAGAARVTDRICVAGVQAGSQQDRVRMAGLGPGTCTCNTRQGQRVGHLGGRHGEALQLGRCCRPLAQAG
jgi:hypothetical protein